MNVKIIIVDDDPISVFLCRRILERDNLANGAISFSNGKQAIEYLDTNYLDFDQIIIFLDLNMPVMGGWEFLDVVTQKSYSNILNIIIVTSSFDKKDRDKAHKHELVISFIEKPIIDQSREIIRKICREITNGEFL